MKSPSMIDDPAPDKIEAAIKFLAGTLDIPEDELGPESSMDNTPAWDSSEHMNICLLFEQRFGVKLNMDLITSATSIRALAALIP
jgi:acyl carrier protein